MPRPQVLVVTEDRETADTIRATLTAEGYDVDTAGRAADALERFAQQHYDLLISSVRLPDLGGRELYWALRTRWPSASPRVIFLVPAGAPILPPAGGLTELGARVLPLPFTPAALRDVVRRALGVS
jgi:two-component system NtrC family sensor kinase